MKLFASVAVVVALFYTGIAQILLAAVAMVFLRLAAF